MNLRLFLSPDGTYTMYLVYLLGTLCLAAVLHNAVKLLALARRYRHQSGYFKDFAGPTSSHWLFGNLGDLPQGKAFVAMAKWAKEYGPSYKLQIGPFHRVLALSDPECIKVVLSNADPKEPISYGFLKKWLGDGLLISDGKKWARNRRLLTPSFHFNILRPYQKIFSDSANAMTKKWTKKHQDKSVEMFECVSLMTLDSLMKCLFGIDHNFQEEETRQQQHPYVTAVYELSDLIMHRFRTLLHYSDTVYYLSSKGRRFREAVNYAQAFSKSLIDSKREEKQQHLLQTNRGQVPPPSTTQRRKYVDFLDTLLDCRDEEGNGMTNQEIQDEMDTFLFEGHDTTASGISWCLYNLARHPELQQRCRDEVQAAIGDKDEVLWEDIGKLSYLGMCIKESMRLHNPVGAISRRIAKQVNFPDGRSLPAGSWIAIDINGCHHNRDVWPDPERYDPDRFLPENSKERHSHAFLGFSAGPRNCIGQHFALNEMKTVLSLVLKNFQLELDATKPVDPFDAIILRSSSGIWLKPTPLYKK